MDPILTVLLQSNEPLDDSQARHVRATLDATLTGLEDLEGEISKTLLALVKLENERRRRSQYADILMGTLSPIRRIPSEILVEIFLTCRDNTLSEPNYSITDSRQAPMLMGHVSSRWRQVCHGAPRLWDHFHLSATPGSSMDRTVSQLRPILARSRILPLHVKFKQWSGSPTVTENLFDLIFQTHERLKHLYLCIKRTTTSSKSLSRIFNRPTPLPVLSSIKLIVDETLDAARVLALFHDMRQLRDVHLNTHPLPPRSLLYALPWAQFTRLGLHSALELGDARDILAQCAVLQECELYELTNEDGMEPPHHVHQLIHLQRLAISSDQEIASEFLEAFSFPNLLSLDISCSALSPDAIPNLLAGSKCSLEVLRLNVNGLDLIPLLRQLPSLQTLDLQHCGADNALFKIFTYDPREPVPSFALPQLTSLAIIERNPSRDGLIISDMVESVCAHAGGQNGAFPVLVDVELIGSQPPAPQLARSGYTVRDSVDDSFAIPTRRDSQDQISVIDLCAAFGVARALRAVLLPLLRSSPSPRRPPSSRAKTPAPARKTRLPALAHAHPAQKPSVPLRPSDPPSSARRADPTRHARAEANRECRADVRRVAVSGANVAPPSATPADRSASGCRP
ncbi:hypothetical protein FB451DRAFT_1500433 [Mycena latifolia]|nr:hypothetical protein FB451DRAFT_1500433 [Mycena latifolia]